MNQGKSDKFPFKLAVLRKPADNDLTKQWVVEYHIWHITEKILKRKRVVLAQPTVKERLQAASDHIKDLNQALKTGRAFTGEKPADEEPWRVPIKRDRSPIVKSVPEKIAANRPIIPAIVEYLAFVKKTLARNTHMGYKTSLYSLMNYLNRHSKSHIWLGHFDQLEALTYLEEVITVEGNGNRTRNNRLNDASVFFNYYISRDQRTRSLINPFENLNLLPYLKHKHQAYSKREQTAYRKACEELGFNQLLLFVRFIYYTLARPNEEVRRLRIRDIREKVIYITAESAKTSEGEYIDIPSPLAKLIETYKLRSFPDHYYVFSYNDEPGPDLIGPKYMYRRHIKVLEKMELTDTHHDVYSWKHTGAVALWEATKDIELVRRQCRHKDMKQTIEYLRDLGVHADNEKIHQFPEF
ncbi:tyrosine-type recombinase/integrase [Fibrella aquatica]|uniref:tyrosine-type recombinase/integrase n=1 Tax=Fibrella aquatica TaxID=3242487 RepID=UPI00351FF20A